MYNEPKPGDVIAKWEMAAPYKCNGSAPEVTQNGDNPSISVDVPSHLGGGPDVIQNRSHGGSDPTPAMPGA